MNSAEILLVNFSILAVAACWVIGENHRHMVKKLNLPTGMPAPGLEFYTPIPYVQGKVVATRDRSFKEFVKELIGA